MTKPDWVELGWAFRVQNRVGSGNIGLKGIKGLAQNYQKRDIEFWAALSKVAVKNWSND